MEFPLLEACLPAYLFVDIDTIMPVCTAVFDIFQGLSCDVSMGMELIEWTYQNTKFWFLLEEC